MIFVCAIYYDYALQNLDSLIQSTGFRRPAYAMHQYHTISTIIFRKTNFQTFNFYSEWNRLLDSLVVECWRRVRGVPGSIPSQRPRHTKDVIKMAPVVSLFSTEHSKGKILALSQELR